MYYICFVEENLKQLHDIVEAVQHMKDANVGALSVNTQVFMILSVVRNMKYIITT